MASTSRPEPTDADRAKAAEVLRYGTADARSLSASDAQRVAWVAAALASERAAAVADYRARVETLAEECQSYLPGMARRLRAAVTDTTGDPT